MSTDPDALYLSGALIRLVRSLEQRVRAMTGPDALTLQELGVLGQVERGVDAPSQIARALQLDPARVTHLVDRLQRCGHIEREGSPGDRRRSCLRLTPQGIERLTDGRGHVRTAMAVLLDGLTDDERAGLVHGLEGVHRILSAPAAGDVPTR